MGLFIGKNDISPSQEVVLTIVGGFTTDEAYVNISEYYKRKNEDRINLSINLYKSKQDRIDGKRPIASSEMGGGFVIDCTVEELEADDIFTIAYAKLTTALEAIFGEGKIYDDI